MPRRATWLWVRVETCSKCSPMFEIDCSNCRLLQTSVRRNGGEGTPTVGPVKVRLRCHGNEPCQWNRWSLHNRPSRLHLRQIRPKMRPRNSLCWIRHRSSAEWLVKIVLINHRLSNAQDMGEGASYWVLQGHFTCACKQLCQLPPLLYFAHSDVVAKCPCRKVKSIVLFWYVSLGGE